MTNNGPSEPRDSVPQSGDDPAGFTGPKGEAPEIHGRDESTASTVVEAERTAAACAGSAAGEEVVLAELVHVPAARPRIWTALLVATLAIPLATVVGGVFLVAAMLASDGGAFLRGGPGMDTWLEDYTQTRLGLFIIVVPGQLVFLAAALGAAWLSPQPWTRRLGLGRGNLPWWSWFVLMLGTPVIGALASHFLSLTVDEMSDHLKLVETMLRTHVRDFPVGLIAIVAVVPGFAEELLFRGYLQNRLLQRWPPVFAVGVSALVFSAAHLDPTHVVGVIPLGLWLGAIAWRAGSIWPAVLCHAANNAAAVAAALFHEGQSLEVNSDPFSVTLLAVSGPAFLASLGVLGWGGVKAEDGEMKNEE